MPPLYTIEQVRAKIRASVKTAGSQKALAARLGVSQAYLSDVLLGKRTPGKALLIALGLSSTLRYRPIGG